MGSGTPVLRVVSDTPVATVEPEQLRAALQQPIQQKPLLALEDRVGPAPESSQVDRAQEQLKSSVAVVTASPTRGRRSDSSVPKKPAGKKASKAVLKKPAGMKNQRRSRRLQLQCLRTLHRKQQSERSCWPEFLRL